MTRNSPRWVRTTPHCRRAAEESSPEPDGRGRIRHLAIEPAAFEQRDAELLADLILGATAEAQRRAAELSPGAERPAGSPLPGDR